MSDQSRRVFDHWGVLVFSSLSHGAALGIYRLWIWDRTNFPAFRGVILFLFTFSLGLTVLAFLARKQLALQSILLLRSITVVIVVYSFGIDLFVGWCLLIGLIYEVNTYELFPLNVVLDLSIVIGAFMLYRAGAETLSGAAPRYIPDLLVAGASLLAVGTTSILATRYRKERERLQVEVRRLDSAMAELSNTHFGVMRIATTARERSMLEERNRITREIHDTIGYSLTNVSMMLEAARDLAKGGSPKLHETLLLARSQTQHGLEETRRVLHLLRGRADIEPIGLPAIQRMVHTFSRASGIHVEVEYGALPLTSGDEVDTALFHFVQEGLTNALRHGHANAIRVALWIESGDYHAIVRDNGVGSKNLSEGIGMMGMRERLGKLGGTFSVRNVADGFEIRACIPRSTGE